MQSVLFLALLGIALCIGAPLVVDEKVDGVIPNPSVASIEKEVIIDEQRKVLISEGIEGKKESVVSEIEPDKKEIEVKGVEEKVVVKASDEVKIRPDVPEPIVTVIETVRVEKPSDVKPVDEIRSDELPIEVFLKGETTEPKPQPEKETHDAEKVKPSKQEDETKKVEIVKPVKETIVELTKSEVPKEESKPETSDEKREQKPAANPEEVKKPEEAPEKKPEESKKSEEPAEKKPEVVVENKPDEKQPQEDSENQDLKKDSVDSDKPKNPVENKDDENKDKPASEKQEDKKQDEERQASTSERPTRTTRSRRTRSTRITSPRASRTTTSRTTRTRPSRTSRTTTSRTTTAVNADESQSDITAE